MADYNNAKYKVKAGGNWKEVSFSTRWQDITDRPPDYVPSTHTHGNISNDGKVGSTANLILKTTTGGLVTTLAAGTTSQYLRGDGTWQPVPAPTLTKDSISTALKTSIANIELGENNGTARSYSVVIGDNAQATSTYAIAIGRGSTAAQYAVGIGSGATAGGRATGTGAVAIGAESTASAINSITIGRGAANSTANSVQLGNANVTSLKVGNYTVPLPTNTGTTGQVLTKTATGSSWQNAPAGGGGVSSELEFIGSGYAAYDGSIPIKVQAGDGIDIVNLTTGDVEIKATGGTSAEGPIYGYSTTAVGTTAKVVSATSSSNPFTDYKKNQLYIIEFTTGNTATAPTININSAGAKTVRHLTTGGATTTNPGTDIFFSRSRGIGTFVYDGTYMILLSYVSRYHNALETKMLSYSKGSSGAAVATSDTVSSAIGKLEYRLDNMGGGGGLTRGSITLDMSSSSMRQFSAPAGTKFLTLTKFSPGGAETTFVEMSVLELAMTYNFNNFWSGLNLSIVEMVGYWVFEVNDTNYLGFQLQIAWYS